MVPRPKKSIATSRNAGPGPSTNRWNAPAPLSFRRGVSGLGACTTMAPDILVGTLALSSHRPPRADRL